MANVRTSGYGEVNKLLLWDLPNSLVQHLEVCWNFWNVLNRSIISDKLILNLRNPKIDFNQILYQMLIHADEFSSENSSGVDISCEWLKTLVIS